MMLASNSCSELLPVLGFKTSSVLLPCTVMIHAVGPVGLTVLVERLTGGQGWSSSISGFHLHVKVPLSKIINPGLPQILSSRHAWFQLVLVHVVDAATHCAKESSVNRPGVENNRQRFVT